MTKQQQKQKPLRVMNYHQRWVHFFATADDIRAILDKKFGHHYGILFRKLLKHDRLTCAVQYERNFTLYFHTRLLSNGYYAYWYDTSCRIIFDHKELELSVKETSNT